MELRESCFLSSNFAVKTQPASYVFGIGVVSFITFVLEGLCIRLASKKHFALKWGQEETGVEGLQLTWRD